MKRAAIVTILSDNFGNRLQNYALQEVVSSFGYKVETMQKGKKNSKIARNMKYHIKHILGTKDWKFRKFDRNIRWSPYSLSDPGDTERIIQNYAFFIAGSDQVWNPTFSGTNDISFLAFAPREKRISYAASFGVAKLPEEVYEKYGKYLRDFSAISVREKQAVAIVEQFRDCEAELVLDPTLLIPKQKWKQLSVPPKQKSPFVLKYFLGCEHQKCDEVIQSLLGNTAVINEENLDPRKKIGPSEFLGLIQSAELICTDSFHASVFSTIFEKPFVIFERMDKEKDMSSRIDSLCDMLALHEHRYASEQFDLAGVMHPNYETTFGLLESEKQKSMHYLRNALKAEDYSYESQSS